MKNWVGTKKQELASNTGLIKTLRVVSFTLSLILGVVSYIPQVLSILLDKVGLVINFMAKKAYNGSKQAQNIIAKEAERTKAMWENFDEMMNNHEFKFETNDTNEINRIKADFDKIILNRKVTL